MGKYETELRSIVENTEILSDLNACIAAMPKAVEYLDTYATVFKESSEFPGLQGTTGTKVTSQFVEAGTTAATNSQALDSMTGPLKSARAALMAARRALDALPDATISTEQRVAILAGAFILSPGFGLVTGHFALEKHEEGLRKAREKAARDALRMLETDTFDPAGKIFDQYEILAQPISVIPTEWETEDGPGRFRTLPKVLPPQPPSLGGGASGSDLGLGSWDEPIAAPTMVSPGGVAAGVVGAGAIAGLGAGLGKIGGGTAIPGPGSPGGGGSGGGTGGGSGGGQGLGGGGIGSGSRVSADSASAISRTSSSSGSGMNAGLSGGLSSGRAGLGGMGAGGSGLGGGLGGAGTGASGGAGVGMAGSGSAGGAGLGGAQGLGATGGSGTGAAGAAGKGGMMMGGGGAGGAGSEKDKSRAGLGYRAPKIEAAASVRRRAPAGQEGSRADFPETPPQPTS